MFFLRKILCANVQMHIICKNIPRKKITKKQHCKNGSCEAQEINET